jgi:hypothetical protein
MIRSPFVLRHGQVVLCDISQLNGIALIADRDVLVNMFKQGADRQIALPEGLLEDRGLNDPGF